MINGKAHLIKLGQIIQLIKNSGQFDNSFGNRFGIRYKYYIKSGHPLCFAYETNAFLKVEFL